MWVKKTSGRDCGDGKHTVGGSETRSTERPFPHRHWSRGRVVPACRSTSCRPGHGRTLGTSRCSQRGSMPAVPATDAELGPPSEDDPDNLWFSRPIAPYLLLPAVSATPGAFG